jgi:ABC-type transport system involved in cytochrome bd biosynthesis fused ATPase/permease subunit
LILDEPTSTLDEKTQNKIIKEIFTNNRSKTIIFVTHDKDNLVECDKIYKLENKKLILIN